MVNPVIPRNLFKVNRHYDITSFDDGILVIDNFYERYEEIYSFLNSSTVPIFNDPGPENESRNFKDYYQCRPSFFSNDRFAPHIREIKNIIGLHFELDELPQFCNNKTGPYEFNFFKYIKNPDQDLQAIPHVDYDWNAIVYFDKVSSGGTAIYENITDEQKQLINQAFLQERIRAGIDVKDFDKKIIQSKPNRLVIFKGNRFHNGYISNHKQYLHDWRIVQIMFFK